jgi:hypothetical protein
MNLIMLNDEAHCLSGNPLKVLLITSIERISVLQW